MPGWGQSWGIAFSKRELQIQEMDRYTEWCRFASLTRQGNNCYQTNLDLKDVPSNKKY